MRLATSVAVSFLAAALGACGDDDSAVFEPDCVPTIEQRLQSDEKSPLGFAAAEAAGLFKTDYERELVYQRTPQVTTNVTVRLVMPAEGPFFYREFETPGLSDECTTHVGFLGRVQFTTEDGFFGEDREAYFVLYSAEDLSWHLIENIPNEQVAGTFSIHEWMDTSSWTRSERETFELAFTGFVAGEYIGGTIGSFAYDETEDAYGYMYFPLAFWGVGPPGSDFPIQPDSPGE